MLLKYFQPADPPAPRGSVAAPAAPESGSDHDLIDAIIRDEDELKKRRRRRHGSPVPLTFGPAERPRKKPKTGPASASGASADTSIDDIESFPLEPENIDPASDISRRHSLLPSKEAPIKPLSLKTSSTGSSSSLPVSSRLSSLLSAPKASAMHQSSLSNFLHKKTAKRRHTDVYSRSGGRWLPPRWFASATVPVSTPSYTVLGCGQSNGVSLAQAFVASPRLDTQARVHAYVRSSRRYPQSAAALTALEFDRDGCLLVGSEPKGGIRVFDFDSYLPKAMAYANQIGRLNNRKNNATAAMFTGNRNTNGSAPHTYDGKLSGAPPLEPIHCIETPDLHCQALAWHPSDPNQIVAGFLNNRPGNSVHIYDLGDFPTEPVVRLKSERKARFSEVNDVLCFSASWKHGGGAPNVAAAGGREKVVRVWDIRQPQSVPAFVFGPSTSGGQRKADVKAICYCPARGLLFYGDANGGITAHDMRKMTVQTFSTKKLPRWHSSLNVANKGIVSLTVDPSGSGQLAFRMQNGSVGIVECGAHGMKKLAMVESRVPPKREAVSAVGVSAPPAGTRHEHASVAVSVPTSTAASEAAALAERRRLKMMPTRTIRYVPITGRRNPVLCVGSWNMSCVQFVSVDTCALARQHGAVAPAKYPKRAPKPRSCAGANHFFQDRQCVALEYNGKKSGGGVTALACHQPTGSVVACLDDGRTVAVCAGGRM